MLGARTARIAQRDRLRERTRCWHGFRVGWQPWSAASAARAAQVLEAQLPQRTSRMRRAPRAVHPYLCLAVRAGGGPGGAATGGQTARTSAKRAETRPVWRETFHLCIGDASPVLEIVAMHAGSAAGARPPARPRACLASDKAGRGCREPHLHPVRRSHVHAGGAPTWRGPNGRRMSGPTLP